MARGLERSSRLVRSAQTVLWPTRSELGDYRPSRPERTPLVLRVRPDQVVGLTFDPQRKRLLELTYAGPFDPAQPYPPGARALDLGPCTGLVVRLEGEQLRLTLAADNQLPWTTTMDWHGVLVP